MPTLETNTRGVAKSRGTARPKGNRSHKTTPQCCSLENWGLDAYTQGDLVSGLIRGRSRVIIRIIGVIDILTNSP